MKQAKEYYDKGEEVVRDARQSQGKYPTGTVKNLLNNPKTGPVTQALRIPRMLSGNVEGISYTA